MDISFRTRTSLSILLIVVGSVSGIVSMWSNPWLMLVAGVMFVIAVILWVDDIRIHNRERDDFKKKIIPEALGIVDHIIVSTSDTTRILYPVWSLSLKPDTLSDEDYKLWKRFYDTVEQRNEYLAPRISINWTEFVKYNHAIFDSFSEVYAAISWVRAAIPEERITDLRSRAERSASL